MSGNGFRFFEFGEFRLDAHERTLQKNGEPIHLTPRIFDLLLVLVENPGRVLEHDELLDKVWEGAFVEQTNLKKSVSTLRQALGESPEVSRFIKTIPRRGYSFIARVRPLPDAQEMLLVRETKTEIFVEEEIEDKNTTLLLETKKTRPFHIRRIALIIGAIFILTSIVFAAWFFLRKQPQRFPIANVHVSRLFSGDNIVDAAFSRDGNLFVYNLADKGKNGLWVKQGTTGNAVQVIPPMNASFWFTTITPDNDYIYTFINNRNEPAKSGLYRLPIFGGSAPQLITEKRYTQFKFSPDGKRLAVVRTFVNANLERQELLTINPDNGGDEKVIISLPDYHIFRGITWSPDGSSLFYAVKKQMPSEKLVHYIAEISSEGGAEKIIMPANENLLFVEDCMPDKSSLLLRQREPSAEIYQIWQYFPSSGEMLRVTKDDYSYTNVTVTSDGKRIEAFRAFRLTSIWLSENDKYDFRQIASGVGVFFHLGWTANEQLVFTAMENGSEFVGIMNPDGSQKRFLTTGEDGIRLTPSVSGDGKYIVFISSHSGSKQICRIDLDGRNLTRLTDLPDIGDAKLLSDGQTVIYTAYLKTVTWSLEKQTADGKTVHLTNTDTIYWDISPDEKYLAVYGLDEKTKKNHIFVQDMESGSIIKTFDSEKIEGLRWTRDGKSLSVIRINDDFYEIVLLSLDGKAERVLTTVRGEQIINFAWSRDGKKIALVRSKAQNDAALIQTEISR